MKRLLTLLMALAMTASLAACGGTGSSGDTADSGNSGTTAEGGETAGSSGVEDGVLTIAMECAYAPYNWSQSDDSNGAVPISNVPGTYANGYDVMIAKQICDAVDAGDALAQELFDEYCGYLANGLASFVYLFQPESIVLGGGVAGYGEKLLEPLRMLTFPQPFRGEDRNTEIVCASLGNDAGLVGAAMLVE